MLRFRSQQGRGYFSPRGVALFAGGQPCLFNGQAVSQAGTVLLTEGEIKALAAQQAGIPAAAQPGIGHLPDEMIQQLAGKTVDLCYDSEERKNPFILSPGEKFTITNGQKLYGAKERKALAAAHKELECLYEQEAPPEDEIAELKTRIRDNEQQLNATKPRVVRIARLPRLAGQAKVDIDDYTLAHGADALQQVVRAARPFSLWYELHNGQGYYYDKGGIWGLGKPDKNGYAAPERIANYQARITEHITVSDGQTETIKYRIVARTPGGELRSIDIEQEQWTDDRQARQALRCVAGEATADDLPRVVSAVKALSMHGDSPARRRVFTATGWEQIDGKWHYLTSDGAVHSQGTTDTYRAEIDAAAIGNHYALTDERGSAGEGWAAWKRFLSGDICPQPLALLLAGNAALALLHRFSGNSDRPLPWLQAESGALKTALTRAGVMALWGSRFTSPRGAGAAVSKWDATGAGLEYTAFYFRDAPLLIDDYKQGVINDSQFKRFLHNYSEGTGRTRGTKARNLDRVMPARAIAIATGEDTPGNGDSGITARITALPLQPGAVNPDSLAELQQAGAAGHLVAFWRGFVQTIATALDSHGADGLQALLQQRIAEDDGTLPGHKRASGALRQNRAAFLLLSGWLQQAGYLTADERAALDSAHLQARVNLAAQQAAQQRNNRPATIFLNLIDSLQQQGYVIEEKERRCPDCGGPLHRELTGWHCGAALNDNGNICHYRLPLDRIIGFRTASGQIGLNIEHCWALVQEIRRKQGQPLRFSLTAVQQQLDNDGWIARKDEKGYRVKARNPALNGGVQHCLLLHAAALDTGGPDDDSQADKRADSQAPGGQPAPQPRPVSQPAVAARQAGGAAVDPLIWAMSLDTPAACTECTEHVPNEKQEVGTCDSAAESPIGGHVPNVPNVPTTHTYIYTDSPETGPQSLPHICVQPGGTFGTFGTRGDTPQQEAEKDVPTNPAQVGTFETKSVHAAPQPGQEDSPAAPDNAGSVAAAPQASQADELQPQPAPGLQYAPAAAPSDSQAGPGSAAALAILDTQRLANEGTMRELLHLVYGETPQEDATESEICRRVLQLAGAAGHNQKPAIGNVRARLKRLHKQAREQGAA
jgi:hypothetical protein